MTPGRQHSGVRKLPAEQKITNRTMQIGSVPVRLRLLRCDAESYRWLGNGH